MNDELDPRGAHGFGLDLRKLLAVAWRGRWRVVAVAFGCALLGALFSLTMEPVFRAYAVLAPAGKDREGGLMGLAGQFAGLGDMGGINLGIRGNLDETMAFVSSRGFTVRFLREARLEPLVFPDRWDEEGKEWKSGGELPLRERLRSSFGTFVTSVTGDPPPPGPTADGGPSDWDLVERFGELLALNRDKRTNIVTVSVAGRTAEATSRLTNEFVANANRQLRERAIADSRQAIAYLKERTRDSQFVSVNAALYRVLEQELRTEMLASVHEDYALRVIDAAAPPKLRDSPRRTAITIASGFLGGFLGVLWVLASASRRGDL